MLPVHKERHRLTQNSPTCLPLHRPAQSPCALRAVGCVCRLPGDFPKTRTAWWHPALRRKKDRDPAVSAKRPFRNCGCLQLSRATRRGARETRWPRWLLSSGAPGPGQDSSPDRGSKKASHKVPGALPLPGNVPRGPPCGNRQLGLARVGVREGSSGGRCSALEKRLSGTAGASGPGRVFRTDAVAGARKAVGGGVRLLCVAAAGRDRSPCMSCQPRGAQGAAPVPGTKPRSPRTAPVPAKLRGPVPCSPRCFEREQTVGSSSSTQVSTRIKPPQRVIRKLEGKTHSYL